MSYGRLALAAVAGTVAYFLYGFLVNGFLLRDSYQPFAGLVYRSRDTVGRYMPLGFATTFAAVLVLTAIYAKGYEGGGALVEGGRFGVLVGIFVACTHVVDTFVTINIGARLATQLAAAAFVQWLLVSIVVASLYRPAVRAS
jgi:hypothetical protein